MKRYVIVPFKFDIVAFGRDVSRFMDENPGVLPEMTGIDRSTLKNWYREGMKGKYKYPMMHNFVRVCNLMDVDPRKYFVLDE